MLAEHAAMRVTVRGQLRGLSVVREQVWVDCGLNVEEQAPVRSGVGRGWRREAGGREQACGWVWGMPRTAYVLVPCLFSKVNTP